MVVLVNVLANWMAWRHPRSVQHVAKAIVTPVMRFFLDRPAPVAEFRREDISPFFWANGKMPTCEEWKTLADNDFKDYRLKVYGLVENPGRAVAGRAAGAGQEDTNHAAPLHPGLVGHCRMGRTAAGGTDQAGPAATQRRAVVFYSFGEGVEFSTGESHGRYYDSLSMAERPAPANLAGLRNELQPLSHLHGAPLRLRVENQLGFKMVKWIQAIEFVENVQTIDEGEGGYAEDHEYFGELANI